MKFCQLLRSTARHLPEVQELSRQYKQLKKQIRRMQGVLSQGDFQVANECEDEFAKALGSHLRYLNETFVEREEQIVMRLEALEEESRGISTPQGRHLLIRRCVDFHGELVLFMHWSMLAYTGMVKILKKHRKKTGGTVESVPIETLVKQPFFSPEVCHTLIHRVEDAISKLQRQQAQFSGQQAVEEASVTQQDDQSPYQGHEVLAQVHQNIEQIGRHRSRAPTVIIQQTQVALDTWERLRSSAATPSTVLQSGAHQTASHSSSVSHSEVGDS